MPTFTPPTREQGPLGEGRFLGRYKLARGISIYVKDNVVTEVQFPWQGTIEADGVRFYAGGRVHEITDQEAAILIAAGYAAFIEGANQLPDDDYVLASSKGQPNGVASLNSSGTVPVGQLPTLSPGVHSHDASTDLTGLISPLILPGATVNALGGIRLAGDLGGNATSPTVPGLLNKADVGHGHAASDVTSGVFNVGLIPDLRSTYLGVSALGVANGVAPLGSDGKVPSAYLSSGSSGGGTGAAVSEYALTSNQNIPVPSGTFSTGDIQYIHIKASGADRVATMDAAYRLSTNVGSRTVSVPANQIAVVTTQYSNLISAWVILEVHYSSGTNTPGGTLSAGADASLSAGATFSRTATEPATTITSRSWSIISGPMGEGTTIGNAAALSWVPGSSVNKTTTTDIRQPVCMEMCFEIVSTAENSTTDWTSAYDYIEDIGDQRGYTGGLIGFTSATQDMLELVEYYATQKTSGNLLTPWIPGLQECADVGYGPDASDAAETNLGSGFQIDWANAANTDPIFRRCQRELRKSIYWDEALTEALADGVGPLGLALHYDILVNHGPGEDSESYGGIIDAARASTAKPPSAGGNEKNYLIKLCDLRDAVLVGWGDFQSDGRSTIFRKLCNDNKLTLLAPFSWSVYGGNFSISTRPDPPSDGVLGSYVLRYTATGAGSDDVTVTVS